MDHQPPHAPSAGIRPPALRVAIGERSELLRGAIAYVLESGPGVDLVASCADSDSLAEAIRSEVPDVVLSDIRLPPSGAGGIALADRLRHTHPEIGVVLVSRRHDLSSPLEVPEGRVVLLKQHLRHRERLMSALHRVALSTRDA
jgi:DNA-binding NarL/FixJ family response regulator